MSEKIITIQNKRGKIFIIRVDEEDYDMLIDMGPWHINSRGYAVHSEGRSCVFMHRFLMGLEEGDKKVVDHINRNKLDNRRNNLRVVTQAENQRNRSKHKIGGSRFLGVSRTPSGFMARMYDFEGRQRYLGSFRHEVDAAEAYDKARIAAGLPPANFPSDIYSSPFPSVYTAEDYKKFKLEAMAKDMILGQDQKEA